MTTIVTARVLGHGLHFAPNDSGRNALVCDILACSQLELALLAYLYVFGLIRVFYNPEGPTPAVTPTVTPRLLLKVAAQDSHLLEPSSSNAAELRALTLRRDDHRCVFTGKVDRRSRQRGIVGPSPEATATNVAHIISQSLTDNINGVTPAHQAKFEWARTAGAMLEHFGGFNARNVLNQDNIHSPKNAFTASIDPHEMFDQLDIWLTPAMDGQGQAVPDTYDVAHAAGLGAILDATKIKRQVVFRTLSVDGKPIPAPDPRIIELHAACARIAHMSGAVELLRELYGEPDSIVVMTQPNAAYELTRALRTLQLVSATD
ncbi:hypothetical protein C8Q70DRAFT_184922 [Cubamyces menziesii]|nr:hypothetical protein C8Q70DRAFT_184922 [Cubamyces menziesii]